jgi:predicted tellurium resistance membrane protein TerC
MITLLLDPNAWLALITLTMLEIVLGIDNVVFISILVARLPADQSIQARRIGLSLALLFRIALLFSLTTLMRLTQPIGTFLGFVFSWNDLILLGGGLFLIAKATYEIHGEIEGASGHQAAKTDTRVVFANAILQIVVIDLVFSLDSIITAIGMAQNIEIMIAAVILAVIVMYVASAPVSQFIIRHPSTKMLALAFLLLIGTALVADAFDFHIPRGYIYFAMIFAGAVEAFNILARRPRQNS